MSVQPGPPKALEGVRALDLGIFLAGPFCSTLLAEFGATVYKVEQPGAGDPMRRIGGPEAMAQGRNLWWAQESRNKKSVTCDLRTPRGQQLMRDLARHVDVVAESFLPGTLEGWGLGYDDLRAINPGIILVRVSGFGQSGPNRQRPGFARIAQAYAGLTYLAGESGGPPLTPGSTSLADYGAGLFAAFGTLVALQHRQRTGEGQVVDMALFESIFRLMDTLAIVYGVHGVVRDRLGRFTPLAAPHGQYPTKDGRWVTIACITDQQFAGLVAALGRPELAADERFQSGRSRAAHGDVLNALVEELTARHTLADILDMLDRHGVPGCPVNSIADIFADAHFWERGDLVRVADPVLGDIAVPGPVPHLSRTPGRIEHLGPVAPGEHNAEVYCGVLGLSAAELEALQRAGVI